MDEENIYHAEDWPHGLRCAECHESFVEGQPLAKRLEYIDADGSVVTIICKLCSLRAALA